MNKSDKFKLTCNIFLILEKRTLVFDFDETLAKVSMDKNKIPDHAETVDLLTKKKV